MDSPSGGSIYVLSGEELTFPSAEVRALLETYAPKESFDKLGRRVLFSTLADKVLVSRIVSRAAYCRFGGKFVAKSSSVEGTADDVAVQNIIKGGSSFVVASETVERERCGDLGAKIKSLTGAKVSLEHPDYVFQVESIEGGYVLGVSEGGYKKFSWRERRPRARNFFLPSAIYPKLARLLVNLSRVREGELFADPFCGTGSLLIEGAIMGMKVVGLDLSWSVARGALSNMEGFGLSENSTIIRGDSTGRFLPLERVDAVSTDVPYGRAASTRGKDTRRIIREFTALLPEHLTNDRADGVPRYAVVMRPSHVELDLERKSFQVEEEHLLYVHRNLTRAITVLRRI